MDWAIAEGLFRYWHRFPPQHLLLRGYVGYEAPEDRHQRPEYIAAMKGFEKMAAKQGKHVMTEEQMPAHMKQYLKEKRAGKFDKLFEN